jgi:excisionase family DNA binding protein
MQETELETLRRVVTEAMAESLPLLLEEIAAVPARRWLRPTEAAEYMCVSRALLFKLTAEGALPCCKKGRKTVYDRKDLDAFWWKRKYKAEQMH